MSAYVYENDAKFVILGITVQQFHLSKAELNVVFA